MQTQNVPNTKLEPYSYTNSVKFHSVLFQKTVGLIFEIPVET
jgi:hypothetical protein